MDALQAICERRSIRDFLPKTLERSTVEELVEAASFAPSAHNGQPWEFIFVEDREVLDALNEGRKYTRMLLHAPGAFIVCAKFPEKPRQPKGDGVEYFSIQDTAAAIQNLLLAAHAKGLGTCWIGDFDEDVLRELFKIPQGYAPVAVIAVGYPKYTPNARPRRPVKEILHWGTF